MKTIGLVGGMSWHSTASYYAMINEAVATRLGGHASARISLQSLDFAEVRGYQLSGDWAGAAAVLTDAALRCQAAGADVVAICTNLMHKVAPQVEAALDVPLLQIGDAVAGVALTSGWDRLGILGTRWVMEETFYTERLARHGVAALVPEAADRSLVDRVIFDELTQGRVEQGSRAAYQGVIAWLAARGAQAVVLACTEIGLLIGPKDSTIPVIDSATVHADALAAYALEPALARA
jgi:aspartate racemase